MGLALVQISLSDFGALHQHLTSHNPKYRNMHCRAVRKTSRKLSSGKRKTTSSLRYLHALYAHPGSAPRVEGMISGPGVFWHYEIRQRGGRVQLNVFSEVADARARKLIAKGFVRQILARIAEEKEMKRTGMITRDGKKYGPKRLKGQFYLQRALPGMHSTHGHCVDAVAGRVLDQAFVDTLLPWDLELLRP